MRSLLLHGPGEVRLTARHKPAPRPEDLLLAVRNCGICGTDLGFYRLGSLLGPDQAMPLGHEIIGTVAEAGSATSGFRREMRLVVNPTGKDSTIGCGDPDQGGFSDYVLIRNARMGENVFDLPDYVDDDVATLAEPLAVAMHAARISAARPGQRACVIGAGPIGLGVVLALRSMGLREIAVVDPVAHRRDLAGQFGANRLSDGQVPVAQFLRDCHGQVRSYGQKLAATDLYFDAAGQTAPLLEALAAARPGAALIVVALHKKSVPLDCFQLVARGITLKGSFAYEDEFPIVLNLIRQEANALGAMISHRFPLTEFEAAMSACQDPAQATKVIIQVAEGPSNTQGESA